jgi:hypothetical protein
MAAYVSSGAVVVVLGPVVVVVVDAVPSRPSSSLPQAARRRVGTVRAISSRRSTP